MEKNYKKYAAHNEEIKKDIVSIDANLGQHIKTFRRSIEAVGARRSVWFQEYTGNHVRLILQNIEKIVQIYHRKILNYRI